MFLFPHLLLSLLLSFYVLKQFIGNFCLILAYIYVLACICIYVGSSRKYPYFPHRRDFFQDLPCPTPVRKVFGLTDPSTPQEKHEKIILIIFLLISTSFSRNNLCKNFVFQATSSYAIPLSDYLYQTEEVAINIKVNMNILLHKLHCMCILLHN